ncbi:MAG: nitrate reductase cytochrome c-type subunit; periplasmic nitrate reductase electron transfer subunit [Gammaproteobacteria bacterium]|nr:MAG: nitrate reductase cytochrome c-type subunit; periplasmic nitrate reductase electron transfer subunit [Gammaproteobacteria bacterium]
MKKIIFVVTLIFGFMAIAQAEIQSLRGTNALDKTNTKTDLKKVQPDRDTIPRAYVQQPPMVPHSVDKYSINLKNNKCMDCHSWDKYKEEKATKISRTHFTDRDGNDSGSVDGSRYFCNQCHAPQVDAKPLVENTFTPMSNIQK